jgi:CDP-paratose 2-epimerase
MDYNAKIIFLSTSRVYPIGALNAIQYSESESRFHIDKTQSIPGVTAEGINEEFPLQGARSFYGFSKLASEQFLQECVEFCQAQTVINRCGVIAGPYQMGKVDQGFICFWVARHVWNRALQYFGFEGSGKQVRDVLHIDDLSALIDLQIHQFDVVQGETFNVGGGLKGSTSLKELTELCARVTGNHLTPGTVTDTRTADIRIYISDNHKIANTLKWSPTASMEDIVRDTYHWINSDKSALESILNA